VFIKYRVHQGNLGSTASSLCLCWTILKTRYGWRQRKGIQTVFVKLSILMTSFTSNPVYFLVTIINFSVNIV
jgi:hypothetical protein